MAKLSHYDVIKEPLITEQLSYGTEYDNIYGFRVDRRANKIQIKQAVEAMWGVKVIKVNTMVRKGKPRRVRAKRSHQGSWKRALVKLAEGDGIE